MPCGSPSNAARWRQKLLIEKRALQFSQKALIKKGQINGITQKKLREIEKDEISHALKECNFVKARAARRLGITERMMGYKVKIYGLMIKEVGSIEDSAPEQYGQQEYIG